MDALVTDVARDERDCALCLSPIGDERKALALMPDGVRWIHQRCAFTLNGGLTTMRPQTQGAPCV